MYDLDENGERIFQKVDKSGRKQYKNHKEDYNDWNKKERVEEWRAAWAACCNVRLVHACRLCRQQHGTDKPDRFIFMNGLPEVEEEDHPDIDLEDHPT